MWMAQAAARPRRRERTTPWTSLLVLLALLTSIALAASSPAVYETDEYIRIQPELASSTTKLSARTILAYITPWNPRGAEIVDEYRDKIDYVSPVWYTVLISRDSVSRDMRNGADATYVLSGGPPSKTEEAWLHRKQRQGVKFTPRFYLDAWEQKDYADLLSSAANWERLATLIADEVVKGGYDGVVFESAASHLLFEPIRTLHSALNGKTLTLVLPPLRTTYSLGGEKVDRMQESQNRMIVQSIPQLAAVVDFFSIMTYDMSSAAGRVSDIEGKDFPNDSPLRGAKRGSLRQPGPNSSPRWIEENIRLIEDATRAAAKAKVKAARAQKAAQEAEAEAKSETDREAEQLRDPSNPFLYDDFGAQESLNEAEEQLPTEQTVEEQDELVSIRGKLLMGMPMYGYRYPIFWIDRSTGQGVPVPPPTNAFEGKQLAARSDPSSDTALLPFLRGPGEPVTMDTIVAILSDHDGVIIDSKNDDAEGWFDYTETVTRESAKGREAHGVKPGDEIYWRMYIPLPSTTTARLGALEENDETRPGVSLWELGQASSLLLHAL